MNVCGRWSYSSEFKRAVKATQVCEVATDHDGQKDCACNHFYHEPGFSSCLPVAP